MAADYSQLGYDQFGNAINSHPSTGSGVTLQPQAEMKYDWAVFNSPYFKNFNFNQGSGGTIILGGTANGNGLMKVNNSSGVTVVQADNTGLTVTNGNISVTNASGNSVIDSKGIVSTTNFQFQQVFNGAANQNGTGTGWVDVTGGALSALVLSRTTNVNVEIMGYGQEKNSYAPPGFIQLQMVDSNGGTPTNIFVYDTMLSVPNYAGSVTNYYINPQMVYRAGFVSLVSGTHTLKLQMASGQTDGTANIAAFMIGYTVYGF